MKKFTVYPKEGGKEFTVDVANHKFFDVSEDGRIIVLSSAGKESKFAFLKTDAVAAIVLERDPEQRAEIETVYLIYLKGREGSVSVVAGAFDRSDEHRIRFHSIKATKDPGFEFLGEEKDIYVLKSEVVGIFPVDGLGDRQWRLE